jgi:hypothetical protein
MLVAVAVSVFAASAVFAAEANAPAGPKPAPAPITVKGTVSVVKDANGLVTAVKLTTEDKVVHNVVLDKEGLKLGNEADGKEVEAQAINKKGTNLKVLSFKVVEKAAEKPKQ